MKLLDGKKTSERIRKELKPKSGLKLAVVLAGEDPSSITYVNAKKKACEDAGIGCIIVKLSGGCGEGELIDKINELNENPEVTGILVQLPLPEDIDSRKVLDTVEIKKDVDGLHSYHLKQIFIGKEKVLPCTPKGVLTLLDEYKIGLKGKDVCVVGYSDVVGKPLAALCLNRSATVDVCHIDTKDLSEHARRADIIMSAAGVPNLIRKGMVKKDAVVVDIGITKKDGKIYGDVDFEAVKDDCSYITPVPGGVGPMTVTSLLENMVEISR